MSITVELFIPPADAPMTVVVLLHCGSVMTRMDVLVIIVKFGLVILLIILFNSEIDIVSVVLDVVLIFVIAAI